MRERLGAGYVVRRGVFLPRGVKDAFGRDIEKGRLGVDEPPDQPGAGDAVYLRSLARDPAWRRRAGLVTQRQPGLFPGRDAAFEKSRIDAGIAQPGRGILADFMTVDAIDRYRSVAG